MMALRSIAILPAMEEQENYVSWIGQTLNYFNINQNDHNRTYHLTLKPQSLPT